MEWLEKLLTIPLRLFEFFLCRIMEVPLEQSEFLIESALREYNNMYYDQALRLCEKAFKELANANWRYSQCREWITDLKRVRISMRLLLDKRILMFLGKCVAESGQFAKLHLTLDSPHIKKDRRNIIINKMKAKVESLQYLSEDANEIKVIIYFLKEVDPSNLTISVLTQKIKNIDRARIYNIEYFLSSILPALK